MHHIKFMNTDEILISKMFKFLHLSKLAESVPEQRKE
jgi:hypothetical protein